MLALIRSNWSILEWRMHQAGCGHRRTLYASIGPTFHWLRVAPGYERDESVASCGTTRPKAAHGGIVSILHQHTKALSSAWTLARTWELSGQEDRTVSWCLVCAVRLTAINFNKCVKQ